MGLIIYLIGLVLMNIWVFVIKKDSADELIAAYPYEDKNKVLAVMVVCLIAYPLLIGAAIGIAIGDKIITYRNRKRADVKT